MKRERWKNIATKQNPILKPVRRKCKGGFPCGTRPGDGGVVSPVGESVETSFWDMPFVKEILGYDPKAPHYEDEEEVTDDSLADKLAAKIHDLKKKPAAEQEAAVDEVVDEVVDELADEVEEPEDPNRMGLIRFVKGAHLVYKRQSEDGSYEEMWAYSIDKQNSGSTIKKAILAGTDIDVHTGQSEDGKQQCELQTFGNAQIVKIVGLPN